MKRFLSYSIPCLIAMAAFCFAWRPTPVPQTIPEVELEGEPVIHMSTGGIHSVGTEDLSKIEWHCFQGNPRLTGALKGSFPKSLTKLWSAELGTAVQSAPVLAAGRVVVGTDTKGVVALDLSSGEILWRYSLETAVSAPLCYADGTVFFGDESGVFHALALRDGTKRWRVSLGDGALIKSGAICVGGVLLVGSYDHHLYALEQASGRIRWRYKTGAPVHATPSSDGQFVFTAGCDGFLRVIDIQTGREEFSVSIGGYIGSAPTLSDTHVYFGTHAGRVVAVNRATKKIQWDTAARYKIPFDTSPALVKGYLVLLGEDGVAYALNAATGAERWAFRIKEAFHASPLIAENSVLLAGGDGVIRIVSLETGIERNSYELGERIRATPAASGGYVVVATDGGTLVCLENAMRVHGDK